MPGLIGKKLGMTQLMEDDGRVIPMTLVYLEPNIITQIKTVEKDGYNAIVLGTSPLHRPTTNKKFRYLKEFRISDEHSFKKDDKVGLEILSDAESVTITAVSKGKGFQGVVKRFHFAGGPASHGSHFKREPGSIGCRAKPGRVHKGKKMAGRMGNTTVTKKNVPIVFRDATLNVIGLKGPLPGGKNNPLFIKV